MTQHLLLNLHNAFQVNIRGLRLKMPILRKVAQVPGGIGLSGFLLDLGIALPSSFFLVLMGGVSGILFYLYAKHYRGLNSMVFAFPILIFFFYYRSFPNYMAYWLFHLYSNYAGLAVQTSD